MDYQKELAEIIEAQKDLFIDASNQIWGFAEPRFQEYQSAALLEKLMQSQGFAVRSNLAGEETAFIAEYGLGKPVIAILGEYDSLSGLSQEADKTEKKPIVEGGQGHGCGHQALGAGAAAAACALKEYMDRHQLPGTIRMYGCPAEETASGKAFLVRDGLFDDVDIAITWHPDTVNQVCPRGPLANVKVFYTFHGQSAHAAGTPHLGRSALDALELMSVGVNYMREHMIDDARVHYAHTNSGGTAPNVVQPETQVLYNMRAPSASQTKELLERVNKIAEGAALMTETKVDIRMVAACADYRPNATVGAQMQKHLDAFLPIDYTEEELEYARRFQAAVTDNDRKQLQAMIVAYLGHGEQAERAKTMPLLNFSVPSIKVGGLGSSDVGDVSWVVPTAWLNACCYAAGTTAHSWQWVAQGKSSICHKGMLLAAKVMACTACDFLTDPALVQAAKESWKEELGGEQYPEVLPRDYMPEIW